MATRATLDGVILAEADHVISLEGNPYFPPDSIKWDHLVETTVTSRCFWKGKANYFDAAIDGRSYATVAWTYLGYFSDPSAEKPPTPGLRRRALGSYGIPFRSLPAHAPGREPRSPTGD
ncbi:hypothetical protein BH23ACT5_BH23ACT5_22430 [soil metagenome]